MDRQAFLTLTTSSQWALFLAIALLILSWIEQKKIFQQAGQLLLFLLGLFSSWIIASGQIIATEIIPGQAASVETQALSYFHWLLLTGFLGLLGFVLSLVKPKVGKNTNTYCHSHFYVSIFYGISNSEAIKKAACQ